MSTDRIEKKILLKASKERIWRALADSKEFGHWFGVKFNEPFAPGAHMRGILVGTATNAEIAKMQEPHVGLTFEITIEQMEPEKLFSFRWHPHAVERGVDYSHEPTTLIAFELKEEAGGVMLTVTESGFDQIPLSRRAKALQANDGGWTIMVKVLEEHLAQTA
jgi:uncharacterized protein YndB with AHSA1/START domain